MNVWFALLLTVLSWAASFHLARFTVGVMTPNSAIIMRVALASLFLLPLVSYRERWNWRLLWRHRWALLFLGAVGITVFQIGMFYGLQSSTASNAALIMAFNPAMTAGLSALVDRRAIGVVQLTGLILGLAGVVVVVSHGQWSILAHVAFASGDLLLIAGGAAWSIYSVVLQRRVTGLSVLQVTASTIAICALTMWLAAAIARPATLQWPPSQTWLALLFMGVVGSGLAYVWWNGAIIKVGAARASMFMNLVPVFTMLMGLPLGESVVAAQLIGAALVIAGVWLATRPL